MIISSTGRTVRRPVSAPNLHSARASGSVLTRCHMRAPSDSPAAQSRYIASIRLPTATWAMRSGPGWYQRMTGRWRAASAPRLVSSAYRFATATNSAPRAHTSRNQMDGRTCVAAAPPSTRSRKPEATRTISTNGTCLSLAE